MEADVKPRRRKAEATRRKILRAAHDEFLESGFHGATMAAIARRAGVAVQTVYFVFHTKADLISAAIDEAVLGGGDPVLPQETEWWRAMESEPAADEALRIFVRGSAPLFERAAAISEVLRAAALTDEEVRKTQAHHEELRHEAFRSVLETVAAKGRLADGLDLATATDIFLTIYGDTTYHELRSQRGWRPEQIIEWLCGALPRLLLADTP